MYRVFQKNWYPFVLYSQHNGLALLHKYISMRALVGVNQINVIQSRVIPLA